MNNGQKLALLVVGVVAIANSNSLKLRYETGQQIQAASMARSIQIQAEKTEAIDLKKRADIARRRAASGACMLVAGADGESVPLVQDQPVMTADGNQLSEGDIVCNTDGDTAEIEITDGRSYLTKVARSRVIPTSPTPTPTSPAPIKLTRGEV